ncbi:peptide deformylase [Acetobacteraceae bacterium H6797]|nr:peptide deformylase [Acetobacteraceae bacterium H6797]
MSAPDDTSSNETSPQAAERIDPALLLPIVIAPSAILKAKAKPVGPGDEDTVRALAPKMLATMYKAPGIGLAAPQVNVGLRMVVVDIQKAGSPGPLVMINPEVVSVSQELNTYEEGCLSLPEQFAEVTRPAVVTVRYQDLSGKKEQLTADGLLATCIQHEIDHLNGVLFVDHLSALKRNMIMRKLAKEQKRKD